MNPTAEEKAARTKKIEEFRFKVIRFENRSVFDNLDWVLGEIKEHFRKRHNLPVRQSRPPLLEKRRGAFCVAIEELLENITLSKAEA